MGEFMNIGFRMARAPWIVMLSDDLILCPGALQSGLDELKLLARTEHIGGGAFFWRDYPRTKTYHVKLLRNRVVLVNHGFFSAEALASVGYIDESNYEFYAADGDLTMRLNLTGWKTVALSNAFAEHLSHPVDWRRRLHGPSNPATALDISTFESRYDNLTYHERAIYKTWADHSRTAQAFWKVAPLTCLQGYLIRYLDSAIRPRRALN